MRSPAEATLAQPGVQSAVQQRICGLLPESEEPAVGTAAAAPDEPAGSRGGSSGGRGMHRAAVSVPPRIAHLLRRQPQLVAPAVEAFYTRDAAAMKARSFA